MLIGYARVSTHEQNPDLQLDALQKRRLRGDLRREGLRRACGTGLS